MFVASSDEPKESNNSPKDGVAHVQGTSTIDYNYVQDLSVFTLIIISYWFFF